MTLKEFSLAFMGNTHYISLVVSILGTVLSILFYVIYLITIDEKPNHVNIPMIKSMYKYWGIAAIIGWLTFCVPSTGDLWKVHVDLMKLNMANSDSIKSCIDQIDLMELHIKEACEKGDLK